MWAGFGAWQWAESWFKEMDVVNVLRQLGMLEWLLGMEQVFSGLNLSMSFSITVRSFSGILPTACLACRGGRKGLTIWTVEY